MQTQTKGQIAASVADFRFPRYEEIPDVGLYLEQTVKYINQYCGRLMGSTITASMVSNYVKMKLVDNPVKKQYSREQIAYLFFITVAKSVLSLENIRLLIQMQQKTYESARAYNYFCLELENILQVVFGVKTEVDTVGFDNTDEKMLLRNTIIAAAHKIYLEQVFGSARQGVL